MNRAIPIFLLVCQHQVVTQTRKRCVRFEDLRLVRVCSDLHHQNPVGRSQFIFSLQIAHHQLLCFFPVDTHQIESSRGNQLQCGRKYDSVTPPCPPAGAMIRLRIALAADIIRCHLLTNLLKPIKGPFAFLLKTFSISKLHCAVRTAHFLGIAALRLAPKLL